MNSFKSSAASLTVSTALATLPSIQARALAAVSGKATSAASAASFRASPEPSMKPTTTRREPSMTPRTTCLAPLMILLTPSRKSEMKAFISALMPSRKSRDGSPEPVPEALRPLFDLALFLRDLLLGLAALALGALFGVGQLRVGLLLGDLDLLLDPLVEVFALGFGLAGVLLHVGFVGFAPLLTSGVHLGLGGLARPIMLRANLLGLLGDLALGFLTGLLGLPLVLAPLLLLLLGLLVDLSAQPGGGSAVGALAYHLW